ncbi:MAG TPA: hypothetical protein VF777_11175 [Phycisphaerales bacterium]
MRISRLAIIGAIVSYATAAVAAIVPVSTQGVIVTNISGICNTFEADDGRTFILSTQGSFTAGDRVQVDGSYDDTTASLCFNTGGPLINVATIRPAFAGVGTIVVINGQPRFQTDDGRTFSLQNTGGFRAGSRVYVQGTVTTPSRAAALINNTVIGPAFSDFGRITDITPGNIRFTSEAGVVYSLDRFGSVPTFTTLVGDYVFVEGIRAKAVNGVIPLSSVTARPAFNASGRVVATPSGLAFEADTLLVAPQFKAAALAGFNPGDKVYLRGRLPDDYDFGEAKPANTIRLSRAGLSYTAIGFLDIPTKTVINIDDGTVINIEFVGHPLFNPNGSLVYIAGPIAAQSPGSVTLSHNQTRVGIIAEGLVDFGDFCAPIVRTPTGGQLFPRNIAPFGFGSYVRVRGGLTFEVPCIDEAGLVDNTVEAADPGCINCE